jgi:hypothetical protein
MLTASRSLIRSYDKSVSLALHSMLAQVLPVADCAQQLLVTQSADAVATAAWTRGWENGGNPNLLALCDLISFTT